MQYLILAITLVIVSTALPNKAVMMVLAAAAVFVLVSAVIVQTSAGLITKESVSLRASIKAALYCFFFSLVAGLIGMKLFGGSPGIALIFIPMTILVAQAIAYSVTLGFSFLPSVGISICVMVVTWGLGHVSGLTYRITRQAIF